jgi:hypothetical protein
VDDNNDEGDDEVNDNDEKVDNDYDEEEMDNDNDILDIAYYTLPKVENGPNRRP